MPNNPLLPISISIPTSDVAILLDSHYVAVQLGNFSTLSALSLHVR